MIVGCGQPVTRDRMKVRSWARGAAGGRCRRPLTRRDPLLPVGIPKTRRVKLQEADAPPNHKVRPPCARWLLGTGRRTLRQRDRGPEVGPRSGGSAMNRLARSARALASFASYADPLLSHTEIVSSGPEETQPPW